MSEHVDFSTGAGRADPHPPAPSGRNDSPPLGLVDRLDDLVLRLEVWRERPGLIWSLLAVGALVAGIGWWLGRPPDAVPVEELIPRAGSDSAGTGGAGSESAAGRSGHPSSVPPAAGDGTGSSTPTAGHQPAEPAGSTPPTGPASLVVHVVGEVARPGLVNLAPGSRVDDAVAAAGGVTAAADIERLNLAAPVGDGAQIRVPAVGEEVAGPLVVETGPGPVSDGAMPLTQSGPVNLNTAGAAELESLPGIGPATAAAIITWRTDNGGFLTVDDLTQVPGIGPVKLAALGDLVTV